MGRGLHQRVLHRARAAALGPVRGRRGARRPCAGDLRLQPGDPRSPPDLVERDFTAEGPDRLWVADITYIPTGSGFPYLAVVLDAWSRRVVGRAMEAHLRTELVLQALNVAPWQRGPEAVILHGDRGTRYPSTAFGLRCKKADARPSMGSVGDAFDNALCESFFATLECELPERERFRNQAEARGVGPNVLRPDGRHDPLAANWRIGSAAAAARRVRAAP